MKTAMAVNQIATQDTCLEALETDPDFEMDVNDSVCEAYEFLGTVGLGRDGARTLAIDIIEQY